MEMLEYWVWFALSKALTLRGKLELLKTYSDPEDIYNADTPLSQDKDLKEAQTVVNKCRRLNIEIITMSDVRYPQRLKNISDPPLLLYCKGTMPDTETTPLIGVVGTRKATAYGMETAEKLAGQIAACGGIVISGGAAGIDSSAIHGATLQGGPVIAVLGCGVDIVYPRTNRRLFMDVEENGCLLSEYPPGTPPLQWQFPQRNRIISGMSDGVLLVEAPEKSGALITARNAISENRDVYVVPGNIDLPSFKGSNSLLQEGATIAFSGWDTLKNYADRYPGIRQQNAKENKEKTVPAAPVTAAPDKKVVDKADTKPYSVCVDDYKKDTAAASNEEEQRLLSLLDRKAVPIDDVAAAVGQPTGSVLRTLTKMAMRGLVIMHPGKLVSRK
ncbi:MAG: DNA-processing protein DprA [Oscillospiraceae bacterium]|nr:DNA-processing protein DprA [Oscillospiraceae bacterium]